MAADFEIKSNDTLPPIQARLGYIGVAATPDLSQTGTTVEFILREADPRAPGEPKPGVAPKVRGQATVVDPATAAVRYSWRRVDTDEPGEYLAEWEVTFPNGAVQTFPLQTYHTVEILADLDEASGAGV